MGYSSLHYGASTAAPRSPWTDACSPWTPYEETPAAWPALSTAACGASTQDKRRPEQSFSSYTVFLNWGVL